MRRPRLPFAAACPAGAGFGSLPGGIEREFLKRPETGERKRAGTASASTIDVQAPDGFMLQAAQRRLGALPGAGIKAMDRHRDPWRAPPGRHVAVGVAAVGVVAGIAMAFIPGLLRPLAGRMRGALG